MVTHIKVEWKNKYAVVCGGLENLKAKGICVLEVNDDEKTSLDSILMQMGMLSQKDLWHQGKKKVGTNIGAGTTVDDLQRMTNKVFHHWLKERKRQSAGRMKWLEF